MLKKVIIEESNPNRFQVQIFEYTLAIVLAVLCIGLTMAAIFNLRDGDTLGFLVCILLAVGMAVLFALFAGVRRVTIDRDANIIYMTTRALLRQRKQELILSEVSHLYFRRNAEGHVMDVEPSEPHKHKWIYAIGFAMKDGAEHEFHNIKGQHVYELGKTMRGWVDENGVMASNAPS